jgi:hypothetical protein
VTDFGKLKKPFDCHSVDNPSDAENFGECAYGDPAGKKLMVLYGDSHAEGWAMPLETVAKLNGWQLRVFDKHACPGADLHFRNPQTRTADDKCDMFHSTAPEAVTGLRPDLVILASSANWPLADGTWPTADQWQAGWKTTFDKLARPGSRSVMLGGFPEWPSSDERCLAAHINAAQECSTPTADAEKSIHLDAEQAAAAAAGAPYIPTMQWICADRCEPVIADIRVFQGQYHLSGPFTAYLTGAIGEALKPLLV